MNKYIFLLVLPLLACTLTEGAAAQLPAPTDQPTQAIQIAQVVTAEPITCTVTAIETLNLRDAPGTSAAVIAVLKHGDRLTILPHPNEGNWIRVKTETREGWINSNYCERNSP